MTARALAGPVLASAIIAAWLGGFIHGVFFTRWTAAGIVAAPFLIVLQCWLSVGLFIVAHDCMHGSLAPGVPWVNRAFGRACLALYAGFSFDRLRPKHMQHHAHPGTRLDPDFSHSDPTRFLPWFAKFFRTYFGWTEFFALGVLLVSAIVLLHVNPANLIAFWGLPALLSAAQLFYFGTFLPHRHGPDPFGDLHNARSNEYSWLISLLTCFHFGYHHEHHSNPSVPWWRLPATRSQQPSVRNVTGPEWG